MDRGGCWWLDNVINQTANDLLELLAENASLLLYGSFPVGNNFGQNPGLQLRIFLDDSHPKRNTKLDGLLRELSKRDANKKVDQSVAIHINIAED